MTAKAARSVFVITAPQCDVTALYYAKRVPTRLRGQGSGAVAVFRSEAAHGNPRAGQEWSQAAKLAGLFTAH
jgi:hypothetical protein